MQTFSLSLSLHLNNYTTCNRCTHFTLPFSLPHTSCSPLTANYRSRQSTFIHASFILFSFLFILFYFPSPFASTWTSRLRAFRPCDFHFHCLSLSLLTFHSLCLCNFHLSDRLCHESSNLPEKLYFFSLQCWEKHTLLIYTRSLLDVYRVHCVMTSPSSSSFYFRLLCFFPLLFRWDRVSRVTF